MAESARTTPWVGDLESMIEFAEGGIVSKTILSEPQTKVVLFSFKAGQSLSEHTAGVPAAIHVLRGKASILLGDERHDAQAGTYVYMPANLTHAVDATEDLVFLLTLFRV